MISLKEYLELHNKAPFYSEYEGNREDQDKIINYNKELIEKYPWLTPYNVWSGELSEDYDYSFTWLDEMPEGWRIAFGEQMCEEIQQALLKAQEADPEGGYPESYLTTNYDSDKMMPYINGFRLVEVKEKYGALRIYCNSAPREVHDIIDKYERLSEDYCIMCGQPSKWETVGWISPYCDDCKTYLESKDFYDKFIPIERED